MGVKPNNLLSEGGGGGEGGGEGGRRYGYFLEPQSFSGCGSVMNKKAKF